MKKINLLFLLFFATIFYVSCDDFEDINTDPNSAVKVDPSNLLTTAEYNLYNTLCGTSLNEWGQLMVQYWAQNEYTSESRYNVDVTSYNLTFNRLYYNILKELTSAKELVSKQDITAATKANQLSIIEVLMAQTFGVLADGYGAVPYSEAISENTTPAYDSQETIYKGILATLDRAANSFKMSESSFAKGDVIYNGDLAMWKKFANSLMLRYAMRISDVDQATASTYVAKAIAGGVFTSNNDNAMFKFVSDIKRANPLFRNASPLDDNRDDYCVTTLLVDKLTTMNDPRLEKYAKPASGGTIVGMPYGLSDNDATALKPTTSRPNDAVREATTPFYILTYAEVKFLLAEAYQRGIATGNAKTAYDDAVTASMKQWGIADNTVVSAYLTANPYDATNWKKSIGTQTWVALYMNGFEAWSKWRRYDYPVLSSPTGASISSIPVKLPYPLSETQRNATQLGKVSSKPGSLIVKPWWDVN